MCARDWAPASGGCARPTPSAHTARGSLSGIPAHRGAGAALAGCSCIGAPAGSKPFCGNRSACHPVWSCMKHLRADLRRQRAVASGTTALLVCTWRGSGFLRREADPRREEAVRSGGETVQAAGSGVPVGTSGSGGAQGTPLRGGIRPEGPGPGEQHAPIKVEYLDCPARARRRPGAHGPGTGPALPGVVGASSVARAPRSRRTTMRTSPVSRISM